MTPTAAKHASAHIRPGHRARPAVAPITRAIRKALAASVFALALGASTAPSFAGECVRTAPALHASCRGEVEVLLREDPAIVSGALPAAVHDAHASRSAGPASGADIAPIASLHAGTLGGTLPVDDLAVVDDGVTDVAPGPGAAPVRTAAGRSRPDAIVVNDGSISAVSDVDHGTAVAAGLYGDGIVFVSVSNYGDVTASAHSGDGDAYAYGMLAFGGANGPGQMLNGGDVLAQASATDGVGFAVGMYLTAATASLDNDGSVTAQATASGGDAIARAAWVKANAATVSNDGSLTAEAAALDGVASTIGIYNVAVVGDAYTSNSGDVVSHATGAVAAADGITNVAAGNGTSITSNSGSISAIADGGIAPYGVAEAASFGVYNFARAYDSIVDNTGSISAVANATADISGSYGFLQAKAVGAAALDLLGYGDAGIDNAGDISAAATTSQGNATAWAAVAHSNGLYGGAAWVDNDGTLGADAYADVGVANAVGAYANNTQGEARVVNHGDISAVAATDRGIRYVSVNYSYATAVKAISLYGDANVANYGALEAQASSNLGINRAVGIQTSGNHTSVVNAAGGVIDATGTAAHGGLGAAMGISAQGKYAADVVNDGSITAYGRARGYTANGIDTYGAASVTGVYADAGYFGNAAITNHGDITATAVATDGITFFNAGAGATGVVASGKYDASIVNSGSIQAHASSELGIVSAYGVVGHGKYSTEVVNSGDGLISAIAQVGSLDTDQYAGRAFAKAVKVFGADTSYVGNDGTILAQATVTPDGGANPSTSIAVAMGISVGAYSHNGNGNVVNRGDIAATASADFGYASAYGTYQRSQYTAATGNEGRIIATAQANHGNAVAVGSYGFALHQTLYVPCDSTGYCDWSHATYTTDDGRAWTDNSGSIQALATAAGGIGKSYGAVVLGAFSSRIGNDGQIVAEADADQAQAMGVVANSGYGNAVLANSGLISADATGATANATGALLIGTVNTGGTDVAASNGGQIQATAQGDHATAIGIDARGGADGIGIDNAGTILAAAYGGDATATAVAMTSTGTNTLTNSGTIVARGDGTALAIVSSGNSIANLTNTGTIGGAIQTGNLADTFSNGADGTWHALGSSDFGAGADSISNAGTILLDQAVLHLGSAGEGDAFANSGLLAVHGDSAIALGGSFGNDGSIDLRDGSVGNTLTLTGDLAGQGSIGLDADSVTRTADQLRIVGNVDPDAVQTLAVNLTSNPHTPSVVVPLVRVSGDATAGNFRIGDVSHPDGLLTLGYALNANVDASNATDDSFGLGVQVTGLSDAGSRAAALVPGAQSLVAAQVGSWNQRNGALAPVDGSRVSPWLRLFTDDGGVDPSHAANFGSGGAFAFHQANHGAELGLEVRASSHFSLGALLGTSTGEQRLANGAGRNHLEGRTVGVFGTWRGDNGFYLDVSQRWIDLDARLLNVDTKADAQAFNVEAGIRAGTLGGFNVVPQVQYTRTRISGIDPVQLGGDVFRTDGGTASRGRLGVAFDKTVQSGEWLLAPYASLNLVREFTGNYDYTVNGGLLGTSSTRGTGAQIELGLGARWKGWTFSGSVGRTDGGAFDNVVGSQLTARYSW